jgi:BASS family bile acid:Na+ symporter
MFMMGLSLEKADAARILADPRPVAVGVALQFLLMPILALTLAELFQLSAQLTFGMVLLGSCAGGTASNVICYLARGDVALSVSMTFASTLVGVVATPLLCQFYLSQQIDLDRLAMVISLVQIVFLPVTAGFMVRAGLPRLSAKLQPMLPSLSIVGILAVIAIVVALNAGQLGGLSALLIVAVVLHNLLGIVAGFLLSRLFGFDLRQSQTIAIEVGMQNSGLAAALSLQFFSATAALPAALFSIWHNVSGALLAGYWGRRRDSLQYLLADIETIKSDGA